MYRLIASFGIIAAFVAGRTVSSAVEPAATQDVIMITGISPETLVSGEEVEVTVKVAYTLRSHAAGAIRLTANILAPNGDRNIASVGVKEGVGEVTLRAKIVPRYWSDAVSFGVNAALVVAVGDALQTRALSVDRANLPVKPNPDRKSASFWPTVPTTYVDGVSIISVSPEAFSDGVEHEIVVKVKYELLSREEGEITLGVSFGNAAVRPRIGGTRVKIGKGETEVRAIFVPKKTAGLPVAQLLIMLTEFPHDKASSALAWDEATIAVK